MPSTESLNTYFAVGIRKNENPHHVAELTLKIAKKHGLLFRHLEVLDTITVGAQAYLRCRTDLLNPYPMLDSLYANDRSVISSMTGGEYVVRLLGGRMGKVSNLLMHASAKLGQSKMYLGTKMKHWERQFQAA